MYQGSGLRTLQIASVYHVIFSWFNFSTRRSLPGMWISNSIDVNTYKRMPVDMFFAVSEIKIKFNVKPGIFGAR